MVKTKIKYSWIYNKQFNPGYSREDLLKLKNKCENFESLYDKKIERLLELIEKYSKKWSKNFIPIYIVENNKSFSDPLTLKFWDNERIMIIILAHELLHNNIGKKFSNPDELHKYMKPILRKIIEELDEDLMRDLDIEGIPALKRII